ncbi:Thymidylate kinase [Elasticomyces elasticus]|nr:Thymidylate kinase [Elasticomyces elasticus]
MDKDMAKPRGTLIAFEGLDRSGKSTQCQLLVNRLRDGGHAVEHMRFPNRSTPIGQMINNYLAGDAQTEDHVIHLLFSANRWESAAEIAKLIAEGTTVVMDRYYYSGIVYTAAKSMEGMGLDWCRQPEVGLPRPDVCVFLGVDAVVAEQRGGFGAERYENREMQLRVRQLFDELRLNGKYHESKDIEAFDAGKPVEDVHQDVWHAVERVVKRVIGEGTALRKVEAW